MSAQTLITSLAVVVDLRLSLATTTASSWMTHTVAGLGVALARQVVVTAMSAQTLITSLAVVMKGPRASFRLGALGRWGTHIRIRPRSFRHRAGRRRMCGIGLFGCALQACWAWERPLLRNCAEDV